MVINSCLRWKYLHFNKYHNLVQCFDLFAHSSEPKLFFNKHRSLAIYNKAGGGITAFCASGYGIKFSRRGFWWSANEDSARFQYAFFNLVCSQGKWYIVDTYDYYHYNYAYYNSFFAYLDPYYKHDLGPYNATSNFLVDKETIIECLDCKNNSIKSINLVPCLASGPYSYLPSIGTFSFPNGTTADGHVAVGDFAKFDSCPPGYTLPNGPIYMQCINQLGTRFANWTQCQLGNEKSDYFEL